MLGNMRCSDIQDDPTRTQPTITSSKLAIETLEQGAKYIQS